MLIHKIKDSWVTSPCLGSLGTMQWVCSSNKWQIDQYVVIWNINLNQGYMWSICYNMISGITTGLMDKLSVRSIYWDILPKMQFPSYDLIYKHNTNNCKNYEFIYTFYLLFFIQYQKWQKKTMEETLFWHLKKINIYMYIFFK